MMTVGHQEIYLTNSKNSHAPSADHDHFVPLLFPATTFHHGRGDQASEQSFGQFGYDARESRAIDAIMSPRNEARPLILKNFGHRSHPPLHSIPSLTDQTFGLSFGLDRSSDIYTSGTSLSSSFLNQVSRLDSDNRLSYLS